ncbi:MAG: MFS transporter [Pseudomonadales bacterium]|nr:MFS transporter [Pseudomonadales bacterium]
MTTNTDINKQPLSFVEKVGYGLGDMASNFYLGFFGLFLLYYYTDIYGLAPAAVGTMLLISKLIDAFSDPLMGLIADRTSSKWGKYRPYLLWVAVPYGLLGYAIFYGPELSTTGKLIYAYVTYISVMLAFTAVNVPYSALLAVISPVATERTKATQFRFIFAAGGGLMVAAFATPLSTWLGGGDDLLGFRLTMALFAVLSVGMFWLTFFTTRERIVLADHSASVGDDFRGLVKNVSWIVLAIAGIILITGLVTRFASTAYYVKYYLADDGVPVLFGFFDRIAVVSSAGLIGQIVGALLTPALVARFEKHHLVMTMCWLHAVLLVACYIVPPAYFWTIALLNFLGITTFGVVITLLFTMYTDCAEYGEWTTGQRSSGLTVSASMFSLKFGSAVGGALPGFILAYVGFIANQSQSDDAIMGIRVMFNMVPAVLFFLGGCSMILYKIDQATITQMETDLDARRVAQM